MNWGLYRLRHLVENVFARLKHFLAIATSVNCQQPLNYVDIYLNNIQEQDHRFVKRRVRQSQWFQSFNTARKTINGYEAMHMIRKGQVKNINKGNVIAGIQFINNLFAPEPNLCKKVLAWFEPRPFSRIKILTMVFKLCENAQVSWLRIRSC